MNFFRIIAEKPSLQPPTIFELGAFPITSSFLTLVFIILLLTVYLFFLNRKLSEKPTKLQIVSEMLYEGLLKLVDQITGNRRYSERISPLILAIFIFVGLSNLVGFIPGLTNITWDGKEVFRSPTSDFNTTFSLALGVLLLVQFESIRDWGFFGYLGRFFQFKGLWNGFRQGLGEGLMAIVNFLLGLLDIVSEIAKVISLSVRLFGNIFAGETMAIIILGGLAYGLPAVWMAMSMFTGLVQAIVFGALSAAYYTMAMKQSESL